MLHLKFGTSNKYQKHGPDLPKKTPCLKLKHKNAHLDDLKCHENYLLKTGTDKQNVTTQLLCHLKLLLKNEKKRKNKSSMTLKVDQNQVFV